MAHEDLWEGLVVMAREAEGAGGSSSGGYALVVAALSALVQVCALMGESASYISRPDRAAILCPQCMQSCGQIASSSFPFSLHHTIILL